MRPIRDAAWRAAVPTARCRNRRRGSFIGTPSVTTKLHHLRHRAEGASRTASSTTPKKSTMLHRVLRPQPLDGRPMFQALDRAQALDQLVNWLRAREAREHE